MADQYTQYGPLKTDAGEAVAELLRPIQARYTELMTDRGELASLLRKGADKASDSGRGNPRPGLQRHRFPAPLTFRLVRQALQRHDDVWHSFGSRLCGLPGRRKWPSIRPDSWLSSFPHTTRATASAR